MFSVLLFSNRKVFPGPAEKIFFLKLPFLTSPGPENRFRSGFNIFDSPHLPSNSIKDIILGIVAKQGQIDILGCKANHPTPPQSFQSKLNGLNNLMRSLTPELAVFLILLLGQPQILVKR